MAAYCPYCAGDLSAYTQKSMDCPGCGKKIYRRFRKFQGWVWEKPCPKVLFILAIIVIVSILFITFLKPELFINLIKF